MNHFRRLLMVGAAVCGGGLVLAACGATATYDWDYGSSPALVKGVTGETSIDAGNYGAMVIEGNGTVEAWGQSWSPHTLYQVANLENVVQVVDGNDDYFALEAPSGITPGTCPANTSVWSINASNYADPQSFANLTDVGVVQLAAAAGQLLALTCTGQVYVWGNNGDSQLAMPPGENTISTPTLNPALSALTNGTSVGVEITEGQSFGALLVNGQAYAWGSNQLGQCGCGSNSSVITTPEPVTQNGVKFTSIDSGGDLASDGHNLALDASGTAYCWGDNQQGQCGTGSTGIVASPIQVPGLPSLQKALAGGTYSLFLDTAGTVWISGQQGSRDYNPKLTPVSVLSGMTMISAGAGHSLAAN